MLQLKAMASKSPEIPEARPNLRQKTQTPLQVDALEAALKSQKVILTYIKVDDVANQAVQIGKGTFMTKMALEEAYRIIPIHPDNRHLLGIYWDGQVYVDAPLPFGLRSAPLIFTALADGYNGFCNSGGHLSVPIT